MSTIYENNSVNFDFSTIFGRSLTKFKTRLNTILCLYYSKKLKSTCFGFNDCMHWCFRGGPTRVHMSQLGYTYVMNLMINTLFHVRYIQCCIYHLCLCSCHIYVHHALVYEWLIALLSIWQNGCHIQVLHPKVTLHTNF